ncbi:MAG: phosphoribosyltransferase [Candidatus Thorarchaeota archaeon]
MSERIITYEEYDLLMRRLVTKLKNDERIKNIKSVYGIPRGGLPIAVHISHHLDIKFSRDLFDDIGENTLIVDDITHTGKTLRRGSNIYLTATLFYREESIIKPDFYVEKATKWIKFPWERLGETPNRPV